MSSRKRDQYSRLLNEKKAKKLKEDEDTAKLYEDFVEQFMSSDEKTDQPIQFARGGVVLPGSTSTSQDQSQKESRPMVISIGKLPHQSAAQKFQMEQKKQKVEESAAKVRPGGDKKGKQQPRKIDQVMEQMMKESERRQQQEKQQQLLQQHKRQQQAYKQQIQQQSQTPYGQQPIYPTGVQNVMNAVAQTQGPRLVSSNGSEEGNNLWVGNLAPEVDEALLKREFGRYGSIASVKIMWPRDDDQKSRQRNTGFVAYVDRQDAIRGKDALNGAVFFDQEIKVCWGKSVPVWSNVANQQQKEPDNLLEVKIEIPEDAKLRYLIDTMALYVVEDGSDFEIVIMQKESGNPDFEFLFNNESKENKYYRWRIFSLSNGDGLNKWREESFVAVKDTQRFFPPKACHNTSTAAQSGGAPRVRVLTDSERDKLEDILKGLQATKGRICEAMCFALDNSDAVEDVVGVLKSFVCSADVGLQQRVQCVLVISDILHNSASTVAPNASRYRERLQAHLPDIFDSFSEDIINGSQETDVCKEGFKRHIENILQVWHQWRVFPEDFLDNLLEKLVGKEDQEDSVLNIDGEVQEDEGLDFPPFSQDNSTSGNNKQRIALLMDLHMQMNPNSVQGTEIVDPQKNTETACEKEEKESEAIRQHSPVEQHKKPLSKWEEVDEDELETGQVSEGILKNSSLERESWKFNSEKHEAGSKDNSQELENGCIPENDSEAWVMQDNSSKSLSGVRDFQIKHEEESSNAEEGVILETSKQSNGNGGSCDTLSRVVEQEGRTSQEYQNKDSISDNSSVILKGRYRNNKKQKRRKKKDKKKDGSSHEERRSRSINPNKRRPSSVRDYREVDESRDSRREVCESDQYCRRRSRDDDRDSKPTRKGDKHDQCRKQVTSLKSLRH